MNSSFAKRDKSLSEKLSYNDDANFRDRVLRRALHRYVNIYAYIHIYDQRQIADDMKINVLLSVIK